MGRVHQLSEPASLESRIALLERRLAAAQREIHALREARDIALRASVWGGRRRDAGDVREQP